MADLLNYQSLSPEHVRWKEVRRVFLVVGGVVLALGAAICVMDVL